METVMKKIGFVLTALLAVLFAVSCGSGSSNSCSSNEECPSGQCDLEKGECMPDKNSDDPSKDPQEESNLGDQDSKTDEDGEPHSESGYVTECTPGETRECYEGPSGTKGRGICKAGVMTCIEDGTDWSECVGQVLPEVEKCGDGIDQDCDGSDMTVENATDMDGDGYTYCTGDCCETGWECVGTDPERINPGAFEVPGNGFDDNCNGTVDETSDSQDAGISKDTTDPVELTKAMDINPVKDEKSYGIVSAKLLYPDGSEGEIEKSQYAVLDSFGQHILPRNGSKLLAFSTGDINANLDGSSIDTQFSSNATEENPDETHKSEPPADWFQANGGQTFPDAPGCAGGGLMQESTNPGKPPVRDPIMLELELRAPNNAEAFSIDVYYISAEFPEWVCKYNDFFVMLLDTSFKTDNPELQNPADKNIAMDGNKNPLGINLAKSGLFNVCCPRNNFPSCQGDADLKGTAFTSNNCGMPMTSNHGATGWLTVRGNIVPGENFKLRLALWDTNDHALDSLVLLDNFTWYESAKKPGIAPK